MQITKCFKILQVDNDAPWRVIKKSYYTLAKKLHPDINHSSSDAERKFKEVNLAFQVLRSHFGNPPGMSLVHVKSLKNPFEIFFYRIWQNPKFEKWRKDCAQYLIQLDTRIFHLNIHKTIIIIKFYKILSFIHFLFFLLLKSLFYIVILNNGKK